MLYIWGGSPPWALRYRRTLEQLNLSIWGWINYFSLGNMKRIVTSIDERLRTRLRVIIWKQWKKKSKRLSGLLKLGIPKWIADKVSSWGDHYQLGLRSRYLNMIYKNQSSKTWTGFLLGLLPWTACTMVWVGLVLAATRFYFTNFFISSIRATVASYLAW